jgi:hypothetical protein
MALTCRMQLDRPGPQAPFYSSANLDAPCVLLSHQTCMRAPRLPWHNPRPACCQRLPSLLPSPPPRNFAALADTAPLAPLPSDALPPPATTTPTCRQRSASASRRRGRGTSCRSSWPPSPLAWVRAAARAGVAGCPRLRAGGGGATSRRACRVVSGWPADNVGCRHHNLCPVLPLASVFKPAAADCPGAHGLASLVPSPSCLPPYASSQTRARARHQQAGCALCHPLLIAQVP